MNRTKKSLTRRQSQLFRSLLATAFIANGFFPFVAPAFADGTAAGTSISNTATATYEDPNAPNSPINSTSNTVQVTVAEVAGITVTGSGINNLGRLDANNVLINQGGPVQPGDLLSYVFTVTNVGNEVTNFYIPNVSNTTGPATVAGTLPGGASGQLQYSLDGGANWVNVPAGGFTTTTAIPVNGSVLVRVPVTVQNSATSGDTITARLGQTPGDAQNQPRSADGGDVYTVDANTTVAPINGVREASATQGTTVGATPKIQALATLLKTRTAYSPGLTSVLNDDVLTYGLSLRVEQNDPTNSGSIPAPLTATNITLDGTANTQRILVSDAIPANTVLTGKPVAPAGWKVVYSVDTDTTKKANALTDWVSWDTTAPTALALVKRVGFVNDPNAITSVSPGVTITGFSIQVITSGINAGPATINNIAQVFGETSEKPGTLVYDESGDQTPSNFNGTNFSDPANLTTGNDNTAASGLDPGNNNSGTANDGNGEYNQLTISIPAALSLLNGPQNAPAAVGPTDNNDDFTNKSSLIDANVIPGTPINPAAVSFTNTAQNTGAAAANISLLPTAPTTVGNLPSGTVVTITYQSLSASYTYDGAGNYTFLSGTGTVGGNPISDINPLRINGVASGANVTYGVSVDLPAGTPLSTDTSAQGTTASPVTTVERGFPAPITAFIDNGATPGVIDATEVRNTTIDRVYTGFLQLVKKSRLLQGTGAAIIAGEGTFSTEPKSPQPGNIIEYQITYKNVSEATVGTSNVILSADKVVITENGVSGTNNWAKDNDGNAIIDTSNIVGSAKDSGASTITFFSGQPATTSTSDVTGLTQATDVTRYVNSVTGQIAPGSTARTFTFQRKVN
ncbi:hypothetical protein FJR11_07365 [Anabaena sp. UHCC 0187]|uniref:beta strand repeat-containing protein n=1 Tax=Anabaena sp. UHCC 0187 TaxID=2590018 RepID=UPI001446FFDA|nr:hypothetical protein [Anabaena sp. UHCC 0187]MTJ12417.1 hypothetical protein [Anabaena sp. UHCC 0187]